MTDAAAARRFQKTGLGRGYISELERGLVVPTLHALARIAASLGLTTVDLVVGISPRERLFVITRAIPVSHVRELLRLATRRRERAKARR